MSTTTTRKKAERSKALPWFRVYAKTVDDERLRLLAAEDRWYYMGILCCKGQGILGECDGAPASSLVRRKLAVKLGLADRDFGEAMRRLADVELIDLETLQPLDWDAQQFASDADSTAAERKRRQREREAAARAAEETKPQTGESIRDSHDDVTDKSRVTDGVTDRDSHADVTRTDTDTDTDTDSVSPSGDTGGEPPAKDPGGMTKEELWAASKSMLEAAGMPLRQCGTFVGALVSRHGEEAAKQALRAALLARPADPASYLTAACQHATGQRSRPAPGKQQALESHNRAVAERLAAGAPA